MLFTAYEQLRESCLHMIIQIGAVQQCADRHRGNTFHSWMYRIDTLAASKYTRSAVSFWASMSGLVFSRWYQLPFEKAPGVCWLLQFKLDQRRKLGLVHLSPADGGCAAVTSWSVCLCVQCWDWLADRESECCAQFLAVVQTGYVTEIFFVVLRAQLLWCACVSKSQQQAWWAVKWVYCNNLSGNHRRHFCLAALWTERIKMPCSCFRIDFWSGICARRLSEA